MCTRESTTTTIYLSGYGGRLWRWEAGHIKVGLPHADRGIRNLGRQTSSFFSSLFTYLTLLQPTFAFCKKINIPTMGGATIIAHSVIHTYVTSDTNIIPVYDTSLMKFVAGLS